MKEIAKKNKIIFFFVILLLCLSPFTVSANDQKIISQKDYSLTPGEVLDSDLVILNGSVFIPQNAQVNGDIAILSGKLEVKGSIDGDVTAIAGTVILGDTAMISGDMVGIGSHIEKSQQTRVFGDSIVSGTIVHQELKNGNSYSYSESYSSERQQGSFERFFRALSGIVMAVVRVLLLTAAAAVLTLLLGKQIREASAIFISRPFLSICFGLLFFILTGVIGIALCITIFLIPLAFILVFIYILFCMYGIVVVGAATGRMLSEKLNLNIDEIWATVLGTFLIRLISVACSEFLPIVGWTLSFAVLLLGTGAALLKITGFSSSKPTIIRNNLPPQQTSDPLEIVRQ